MPSNSCVWKIWKLRCGHTSATVSRVPVSCGPTYLPACTHASPSTRNDRMHAAHFRIQAEAENTYRVPLVLSALWLSVIALGRTRRCGQLQLAGLQGHPLRSRRTWRRRTVGRASSYGERCRTLPCTSRTCRPRHRSHATRAAGRSPSCPCWSATMPPRTGRMRDSGSSGSCAGDRWWR